MKSRYVSERLIRYLGARGVGLENVCTKKKRAMEIYWCME